MEYQIFWHQNIFAAAYNTVLLSDQGTITVYIIGHTSGFLLFSCVGLHAQIRPHGTNEITLTKATCDVFML